MHIYYQNIYTYRLNICNLYSFSYKGKIIDYYAKVIHLNVNIGILWCTFVNTLTNENLHYLFTFS